LLLGAKTDSEGNIVRDESGKVVYKTTEEDKDALSDKQRQGL
jgi:hypothetical protein